MPGRGGRRGGSVGLSLTPLIDIVFLLLVFFMLTAHFVEEQDLEVQLPEAQSGEPREQEGPLTVTLREDGELMVEGAVVPPGQLEAVLRRNLEGRPKRQVRVRGDTEADLGAMVEIMDAARAAGAETLDMATRGP